MNPEKLGLDHRQRQVFAECFGIEAIDDYGNRYPQLTLAEISLVLRPFFELLRDATVHNNFGPLIDGGMRKAVSSKPNTL